MDVSVVSEVAFGTSGQRLDVYRPDAAQQASPVVLLWHGRGPDERDVLAPLARATASLGVVCFVPDWRPDAPDGGRSHLRESVLFVRRHAADFGGDDTAVTLAGWSLGGKSAVAVALIPQVPEHVLDGWRPRAVVAMAGGYTTPDPLSGLVMLDHLAGDGVVAPPLPVHLVHGTADSVVDVEQARRLHAVLRDRDWPVTLTELDTDHAGVVMTEYDPEARRCRPTDADRVVRAGIQTARLIARAASCDGRDADDMTSL